MPKLPGVNHLDAIRALDPDNLRADLVAAES